MERFLPHKILKPNPDSEYYNEEVKRLKVKVTRVYNRRKLGERYQEELKRLSKKKKIVYSEKNCTGNILELIITKGR